MGSIAEQLGTEDGRRELLPQLMVGIVRVVGKANVPHEVSTLAREVLELIRETIGREGFALAHQSATRAIEDRAQAARSKRKIDKVLNPEAEARKKLRRSQKKTAYRKKKLEEVKRKRGSGR